MNNEKIVCLKELEMLSQWVASLRETDIPANIEKRARWVFLDDLGAMLGGSLEKEAMVLKKMLLQGYPPGRATVLGVGFPKTNPFIAAEINGMAGCCLELDEGYRWAISHAGIYALPGLLALAEEREATFGELLTALVAAYEVGARLAEAWQFKPLTVHPHGVFTSITTAAAGANLCKLDAQKTFQALSTAAALTVASPFELATYGALIRNAWTGVGASLGLKALFLAEESVCGLPETMYATFHDLYHAAFIPGSFSQGLGERYAIEHGYHKAYACCHGAHSALDALLAIRKRRVKDQETIDIPSKILILTHEEGMSLQERDPETTLGAKFSLPHAAAAAWMLGTGGKDAFTLDSLQQQTIIALREKVVMKEIEEVGPPPYDGPARVIVEFADGTTDEVFVPCALGDPPKPFTEEILSEKFHETVRGALADSSQIPAAILEMPLKNPIGAVLGLLKSIS